MIKLIGVYLIANIKNNKMYVGSSIDLISRKSHHFQHLRKNIHGNKHLQSSYNIYGEENFTWSILEYLPSKENLLIKEQYWIDKLNVCNPKIGYNMCPFASNTLGKKHTEETKQKMRGLKRSEETKQKMRGRKHTEEEKQKMSKKAKSRKHTKETKQKIRKSRKNICPLAHLTEEEKKNIYKNISEKTRFKFSEEEKSYIIKCYLTNKSYTKTLKMYNLKFNQNFKNINMIKRIIIN